MTAVTFSSAREPVAGEPQPPSPALCLCAIRMRCADSRAFGRWETVLWSSGARTRSAQAPAGAWNRAVASARGKRQPFRAWSLFGARPGPSTPSAESLATGLNDPALRTYAAGAASPSGRYGRGRVYALSGSEPPVYPLPNCCRRLSDASAPRSRFFCSSSMRLASRLRRARLIAASSGFGFAEMTFPNSAPPARLITSPLR